MGDVVTTLNRGADEIVALSLNGGRVTRSFRQAVFDAAAREGVTVNELVLRRVAERLRELLATPALLNAMRRASREKAVQFDIEKTVSTYESILEANRLKRGGRSGP